jgi:tetratricopeptide (TPR) repeat protein
MSLLTRFNWLFLCVVVYGVSVGVTSAQDQSVCDPDADYRSQIQIVNQRQDMEKIIETATCGIQFEPKNPLFYISRGWAYLVQQHYELAISDFKFAEDVTPFWEIEEYLGEAYAGLNQHEEAIRYYDQAIANQPDNVRAYIDRGISYVNLGEYEEAIDNFDTAIDLDSENAMAYGDRGWAYANLNEYDAAIADFVRTLDINPDYENVTLTIHEGRIRLGDYKSIVDDLRAAEAALQNDSDNSKLYRRRGIVRMRLAEFEDALSDFSRAIELNPEDAESYVRRGEVQAFFQRDLEAGLADLNQALTIDPNYTSAYLSRGNVNGQLEHYEAAVDDYTHYLELKPDQSWVYLSRGSAYYRNGDDANAAKDFLAFSMREGTRSNDEGNLTVGVVSTVTMSDNRVFRFTLAAKAGQIFKLSAATSANTNFIVDSLLILLGPDGTPLIANDDRVAEVDATAVIKNFEIPEDGTYTLIVTHAGGYREGEVKVLVQQAIG